LNIMDFTTAASYMSYQFGGIILSLPSVATIVYLILIVLFGFFAARSFKNHQVA